MTASKTTKSAGRRRGILKWSLLPLVAPLIALGVAFLETLPALEVSSARPPSLPLPSIEEMQEIATMKVHVSDITTAWDDDWKGAWLVEGDGLLSVDLDHATIERTQAPNGLRFVLPAPRAIQCRVDHERTELHGWVKKDWWTSDTRAALRKEAMAEATKIVNDMVASPDQIEEARRQCEIILRALMSKRGYVCEIVWSDENERKEP